MAETILVVDDEREITDLVAFYLEREGFAVLRCYTGAQALERISQGGFELAILDVMLPDIDGFALCRQIRGSSTCPIIMLTAKIAQADRITGLTLGADDYVLKPFLPLELVARVKAQLRRYTSYNSDREAGESLTVGALTIDRGTHQCWLSDELIDLTPIEFDILWLLCSNRGKVLSAEELFERVWKEKYLERNNTVMVHIRRLRDKLHEPSRDPRFIKTVWGVGYKVE